MAAEEDAAEFARVLKPFLAAHCLSCHGADKQEAQLRYDRLEGFRLEDKNLWALVHEKLVNGEMPPEGKPRPSADEQRRVLEWIARRSSAAEKEHGAGTTRRLNRRELSAALNDLTGLSVDTTEALPGDGALAGFDTGAEALQDAADSVTQIMRVTRRTVDAIRFLESAPGTTFAADLRGADAAKQVGDWKNQGGAFKLRGYFVTGRGALLEPRWIGERDATNITLPAPPHGQGVLRLKLVVSVYKPFPGLPNPRLWIEVNGKDFAYREVSASDSEPEEFTCHLPLDDLSIGPKGVSLNLSNKVELPYAVEGFKNEDKSKPEDNVPGGGGLFRPEFDRKLPADKQPAPFVVLHSIEVESGHVAAWPPAAWETDGGDLPAAKIGVLEDSPACARRLLNLGMERAWRRPVGEGEQARFVALYERLRSQGLSFDAALRATFQAVLLSGGFRYLSSPAQADPALAQYAIASRLSFMLHGAPPDARLRGLAAAGKLRDRQVLAAEVERLLADARSDAFFRPFVTQWLELEQPITIAMEHIQKQDYRFGRYLKASMREETIAYVARLFRENRPARELVASDWTMMNDALALHYGYSGVEGGRPRPVTLRADDPRGGGITSHAGIQSMLCWMGDNWVIYRGAWALRHILDDPPPPPPLEVPELNPSDSGNRGKSFRELLKQHQEDANCAICHKNMDPLGFAFQNFDISGRWRSVEHESYARAELDGKIAWQGVGKTRPVDASGNLPRGERFENYQELKAQLARHYLPDVTRGVLKNLVVYGGWRTPSVDDMNEIRRILAAHADQHYPLRDVLTALVTSPAFTER